ncbi:hypothetical protein [Streptomyces hoynatensis]|uniref:Uncharacterized protein n=1 Tax=Streptomyces hoynatensis TaxID=1141874 RepID=A0A3A9Z394_9ACTN|nr:hypothetical protein [Streptomyces hoynatensis]RKN42479.1 hypothetical protein D7294_13835 [Streptomyces hoynatensis]
MAADTPSPGPGPDFRLRWWALALPAVAFAALLMLLVGSTGAEASAQPLPVTRLVDHLRDALLP